MCFGVKRALDLVESEVQKGETLATLGPLIHNPQVVRRLEDKGVRVVRNLSEVNGGAIVMPSHGVSNKVKDLAIKTGLRVIDATCPFVANVHKVARRLAEDGCLVVVVGDPGHSEVKAISVSYTHL
ncbi:MAG: 4-hydroxy-3-methylbut-2-enyl diphosphate reductase, partial [Armatimonadetes bacterium]|nr:4-hydroxy-3-methylbut-2-enyl diphosphate reductase [Armatimonadota bacterium]